VSDCLIRRFRYVSCVLDSWDVGTNSSVIRYRSYVQAIWSSYSSAERRASRNSRSSASISSIQPSPKGILVDEFGGVEQFVIDRDDFAADGRVEVGDRFDRFDDAELVASLEFVTFVGEFDEDHVAEFVLCEVGDAHADDAVCLECPLVRFQVPSIVGNVKAHCTVSMKGVVSTLAFLDCPRTTTCSVVPGSAYSTGT